MVMLDTLLGGDQLLKVHPVPGVGSWPAKGSSIASQPISSGGLALPLTIVLVPFTQIRLTSSDVPELKIAAGLAVERTWISQFGASIFAPELTSRAWFALGDLRRMQTSAPAVLTSAAAVAPTLRVGMLMTPSMTVGSSAVTVPVSFVPAGVKITVLMMFSLSV